MKTLLQLREGVYDRIDSDGSDADDFFPESRITDAINAAIQETVDNLAMTIARRRWMARVADLSADGDYDDTTKIWSLPSNWRRPYLLQRDQTPIKEVTDESRFSSFGQDGYIIIGQELWLTEDTVAEDLEVWYIRKAAELVNDNDVPDFIEGYDEFLICRAAAIAVGKADSGNPKPHIDEAGRIWKSLIMAARNSALPSVQRRGSGAHGEDWYG